MRRSEIFCQRRVRGTAGVHRRFRPRIAAETPARFANRLPWPPGHSLLRAPPGWPCSDAGRWQTDRIVQEIGGNVRVPRALPSRTAWPPRIGNPRTPEYELPISAACAGIRRGVKMVAATNHEGDVHSGRQGQTRTGLLVAAAATVFGRKMHDRLGEHLRAHRSAAAIRSGRYRRFRQGYPYRSIARFAARARIRNSPSRASCPRLRSDRSRYPRRARRRCEHVPRRQARAVKNVKHPRRSTLRKKFQNFLKLGFLATIFTEVAVGEGFVPAL